ncbi:MAG: 4-(cytidine 5'-diphospho)-2-C-methyl-D-erythritol kinase [Spirochaetales bacterium]|nr:4-(cytidine 5'-diphospho)-2-C-methyl-D-erythritol kinase [Spirochaetales bacterium]
MISYISSIHFGYNMKVLSPAKINIYLHIDGVRNDGFHDLVSLFLMVGLYDEISIHAVPGSREITVVGNPSVAVEHDIMKLAAEKLLGFIDTSAKVSIAIKKRIPIGAGLGGGSSNAAAVLLALNKIVHGGVPMRELRTMAADLGSDVPFFLGGPAAIVTGRGEKVETVQPPTTWKVVLVQPRFSISTAAAFRWYAKWISLCPERCAPLDAVRLKSTFLQKPPGEWESHNSFSNVLHDRFPEYRRIERAIVESGASFVSISGSGSVVYGISATRDFSDSALNKLGGCRWWIKETLARTPYAVLN